MAFNKDEKFYINAIEDNLFKLSLELGKNPKGQIYDGDEIKWAYTGGLAMNRIFPLKLEEENLDEKISDVISKFKAWNVRANLYVCPSTTPKKIKEYLENRGITCFRKWAGMALDLNGFISERAEIPGFTVIDVEDLKTLETWSVVSGKCFGTPENVLEDYKDMFQQAGLNGKLEYYLGILEGKPVATCCTYVDGEIGGLYWVGTLPEARGKGIASSIVLYALEKAASMGCSTSILQASDMGRGVYLKIGFREYCQIDIYMNKS